MLKFYVMKRTEVVNIRYAACDVYIGRAGHGEDDYFGNPFRLLSGMSRGAASDRYRSYFYGRLRTDPEFRQRIHALKGKRMVRFAAGILPSLGGQQHVRSTVYGGRQR